MVQHSMRWVALVAVALAGCGGGAEDREASDDLLAPPRPEEGIQLRMVNTVAVGQEIERCQFFVVPPGGLNLNRERVRYQTGSHHVLLYTTAYTSVPTANLREEPVDTSGVFDCGEGVLGSWDVTGIAVGVQDPDAPDLELPPGVAIRVPAGSVMLMNTHYLNVSPAPLATDTRINLYSIPDAEVTTDGGFMLFYNPFIRVPAFGSSTARMRCPVQHDVTLVSLSSHMHRRGVRFDAGLIDADGNLQETLFETDQWQDVPTRQWLPGKAISAGNAIEYRCDYDNPNARVVAQGPTTDDEMCGLLGVYYPRDPGFEFCSSQGLSNPAHDATWIGDGELTCLEAITCTSSAADAAGYFGCVVDSCPASGPPLSALIHCQGDATSGADSPCGAVCQPGSADPAACQGCVAEACGSQLEACAAAACE